MVATSQMRSNGLLQQSIPFLIAPLYIMVHFSMFSLTKLVAVSAEKSSSLHTIILKQREQTKLHFVLYYNRVYFSPQGD